MKNKLLLLLVAIILSVPLIGGHKTVCPNCEWKTIQSAIDDAEAGDTVLILEGVYPEQGIEVTKPLYLQGKGKAVIDGQHKGEILTIQADSCIVKGLHLKNVGISFLKDQAAIRLVECSGGVIAENFLERTFFGIYLQKVENCIVRDNRIVGKSDKEAESGNAIHIWRGNEVLIENNYLTGHRDGIYFEFVDNSIIRNNISENNIRYGLHFMFSNRDLYEENIFRSNGVGVAVMFSKEIRMLRNEFLHNWGGASYGLLLKEISDGELAYNKFSENTKGIYAEGANRLEIHNNDFIYNGWALDIQGNCIDNLIEENNFIANTFEVTTNSRYNQNIYARNYWSQYRGADLNRDGIGDVPYRPVSLHALIINRIPSASILLHSFLVSVMDYAERIIPSLIPEKLADQSPKMKPVQHDTD